MNKITDWDLSGTVVTFYDKDKKVVGSEDVETFIEDYIKNLNEAMEEKDK